MTRVDKRYQWLVFPASWFVLNLLQAALTGLFKDESYYFFYSGHLAWGYWDHPPATALLIRAGSLLFKGELGVRLMVTILSTGMVLILQKLLNVRKPWLFIALFSSFMVFHISGFMAIPDSALLFFTALFFLVYKDFSEKADLRSAVILGLVMAGMLYSKYLGVMIIFLTVLSNLRLLKSRMFWLSVLVSTILYLPHLFWQYRHDFPSVYYHLLERSHDEHFRWGNFGDYLAGQAGMINPLLFIPVLIFLVKYKPVNAYGRALKFSALGSLLIPLLLMSRGRVEANWTMAGLVPLFIISYEAFASRPRYTRFVYISSIISVIIVIVARIALITNIFPEPLRHKVRLEPYGWKEFSEEVSALAGPRPVVFVSSYQNASQYRFNTGKEAFSFNSVLYRSNQYDLEGIEEELQGKEVLVVVSSEDLTPLTLSACGIEMTDSIRIPGGRYHKYHIEKDYRSYNYLSLEIELPDNRFPAGKETWLTVTLSNPTGSPVSFVDKGDCRTRLTYTLLQQGDPVIYEEFEDLTGLVIGDKYTTSFRFTAPGIPGTYYLRVSVCSGWLPPGINSRIQKIVIE